MDCMLKDVTNCMHMNTVKIESGCKNILNISHINIMLSPVLSPITFRDLENLLIF